MRNTDQSVGTASGFHLTMILLGIAITPVLLSSSSLGNQLQGQQLIEVVALGGVILAMIAAITISVGVKARLPTYGIVKFSFGDKGAIAINILMAISLFGWIAVTANMFGHTVQDLLAAQGVRLPAAPLVALGCLIFTASTAFGFAVLGKVAQLAVPVIALVLCYILSVALNAPVNELSGSLATMEMGVAVSSVVGTIIVLVATLPDFGSFARNRKHALIAALLTFLLAYPLLFWAGATPSAITGCGSLLEAMTPLGAALPAALLLVFACITGNAGNMFQGTLVVSTLLSQLPKWQIAIALGGLSALVGSMDIMAWFIPFLLFLGIATPPVAGIYIADFLRYRSGGYDEQLLEHEPRIKWLTFLVWLSGSAVGFMTANGMLTITMIPSLDSMLVASLGYLAVSRKPVLAATTTHS